MDLKIKYLPEYDLSKCVPGYTIPLYATLAAKNDTIKLWPGEIKRIKTGISLYLPLGAVGTVSTSKDMLEEGLEAINTFILPGDDNEIVVSLRRNMYNTPAIINHGTLIGHITVAELAFLRPINP